MASMEGFKKRLELARPYVVPVAAGAVGGGLVYGAPGGGKGTTLGSVAYPLLGGAAGYGLVRGFQQGAGEQVGRDARVDAVLGRMRDLEDRQSGFDARVYAAMEKVLEVEKGVERLELRVEHEKKKRISGLTKLYKKVASKKEFELVTDELHRLQGKVHKLEKGGGGVGVGAAEDSLDVLESPE